MVSYSQQSRYPQQQQAAAAGHKTGGGYRTLNGSKQNNRPSYVQQQQQQAAAAALPNQHTTTAATTSTDYGLAQKIGENQVGGNFWKTVPVPTDSNTEKAIGARIARGELDLYKSFEVEEDREFYPHALHYDSYSCSDTSSSYTSSDDYSLRRQQQQQQQQYLQDQSFRSPLGTPERYNFESYLNYNGKGNTTGVYQSAKTNAHNSISASHYPNKDITFTAPSGQQYTRSPATTNGQQSIYSQYARSRY